MKSVDMSNINLTYLVGGPIIVKRPIGIFDDIVCAFLDDLGRNLRTDSRVKAYPDVLSFSFFCRKGNVQQLKKNYTVDGLSRLGYGLAFHIAPGNVPVNFAFSYVFGLLSGNSNIVRVSEKEFPQVNIICDAINQVFNSNCAYAGILEQTAIVRYGRNKGINDYLSKNCDVRVIWGGNNTIRMLQDSWADIRCKEITFADRYSIGLIDSVSVNRASDEEIFSLAKNFYNDTYLMDQNACSSPHMIFWVGGSEVERALAKARFWQAVYDVAKDRYDLSDIKVSEKYVMFCEYVAQMDVSSDREMEVYNIDNLIYVISLKSLPEDITGLRGKFGLFFQCDINQISDIASYTDKVVQSCMYYGIERQDIVRMIIEYHLLGIDRVVPFGKSLDIGIIWDGYDLIREMSRVIG